MTTKAVGSTGQRLSAVCRPVHHRRVRWAGKAASIAMKPATVKASETNSSTPPTRVPSASPIATPSFSTSASGGVGSR